MFGQTSNRVMPLSQSYLCVVPLACTPATNTLGAIKHEVSDDQCVLPNEVQNIMSVFLVSALVCALSS